MQKICNRCSKNKADVFFYLTNSQYEFVCVQCTDEKEMYLAIPVVEFKEPKKADTVTPMLFSMIRRYDTSGVSGMGYVLDGAIFHNGKVIVCWRTNGRSSVGIYENMDEFRKIHIASHLMNKTEIIWHNHGYDQERIDRYLNPKALKTA